MGYKEVFEKIKAQRDSEDRLAREKAAQLRQEEERNRRQEEARAHEETQRANAIYYEKERIRRQKLERFRPILETANATYTDGQGNIWLYSLGREEKGNRANYSELRLIWAIERYSIAGKDITKYKEFGFRITDDDRYFLVAMHFPRPTVKELYPNRNDWDEGQLALTINEIIITGQADYFRATQRISSSSESPNMGF